MRQGRAESRQGRRDERVRGRSGTSTGAFARGAVWRAYTCALCNASHRQAMGETLSF